MKRLSFFVVAACFGMGTALAQNAQLAGFVRDSSDSVVPKATVTVINRDTAAKRTAQTNESGLYTVPALPPGSYWMTVEATGFQTQQREGITLEIQQNARIDFTLQVGTTQQAVTVQGDAPLINSTDGSVSTVINRGFVENLPMNGRSFQTLFQLTPGVVVAPANASSPGQFSVNGQRTNGNYVTVDGVSANVGIGAGGVAGPGGAGAQMGTTILGGTNNLVSVDALEEFRIQTSSFAPEYGRTPGGQVSIVTRSGTNQFHGVLFEYFRNDKLDANNWFANKSGQPRAPERQNDFGGVFGGPILRDRTFFFLSYEGLRLRQPQTAVAANVPSMTSRQAAPDALKPYLNAYPLPNGPELAGGFAQENATFSNPSSLDSGSVRIDQRLGNHMTLFGRFSEAPSSITQRGNSSSLSTVTRGTQNTRTATGGLAWIVSRTITNDARLNYTHNRGASDFAGDDFGGATPLTSDLTCSSAGSGSERCLFYLSLTQPFSTLYLGPSNDNRLRQVNLTEALVYIRGAHRFAVGGDVRWLNTSLHPQTALIQTTFTGVGPSSQKGTLLSGINSQVVLGRLPSDSWIDYRNVSLYMQDMWGITPRFNVTYGLRWEINPAPSGPNSWSILNADNPSQLSLGKQGSPLWANRYNNLAPRLGFAYNVFQSAGYETVLRGGAGVFYDLISGTVLGQLASGPNIAQTSSPGTPFPYTSLLLPTLPSRPPYSGFNGVDPNLPTPNTYEWSLAIQQGLGSGRAFSVTYVGSKGIHLARQDSFLSPNPTFSASVNILRANADSRYNSLQAQYQQRLSHGLQVLASYVLANSQDNASTDAGTLPASQRLSGQTDKGPSDFDVRHNGSVAVTYALPTRRTTALDRVLGGWAIDGMLVARSAFPVNVTVTRSLGVASYPYRPDLIRGIPLYLDDSTVGGGRRVNSAAFLTPSELRQGSLGRNVLSGFDMNQINAAVHKSFRLGEQRLLQIRVEFFNLLNHPNFAPPNGSLGSISVAGVFTKNNNFGVSSAMLNQGLGTAGSSGAGFSPLYQIGGPRSVQLSLKASF